MPSFMLLPENETRELVEYVRWLAMRGEYETKIVVPMQSDFTGNPENRAAANEAAEALKTFRENDLPGLVESSAQELKDDWSAAEDESNAVIPKAPRTPSSPESIERGRKLFLGEKAKCASCHGELGRGNGPSTEAFNDVPGKPGVKSDVPGLFDIWGNIIKPRNLTQDVFRGGRRPVDVYRRIHSGIKGTPMQAFGGTLTDEEIWDLVNYVYSIPHTR
jgi:mono/diheme cytochrome c family protein